MTTMVVRGASRGFPVVALQKAPWRAKQERSRGSFPYRRVAPAVLSPTSRGSTEPSYTVIPAVTSEKYREYTTCDSLLQLPCYYVLPMCSNGSTNLKPLPENKQRANSCPHIGARH